MLEATHRKAVRLRVRVTVDGSVRVVEVPSPSRRTTSGRRRPEVQVIGTIVIRIISIAIAGKY